MSSRYADDYHSSSRRRTERDSHPRERIESTRDRRVIDDRGSDRRGGDTQMSDTMDMPISRRMDPRLDPRMDPRMDPRLDSRMDPRMDMSRDSARANTASRIEPVRPDRAIDSRSAEPDGYVRDESGQLYRQVPTRTVYARGDDRDYAEPPPSRSRTAVDVPMRDDRGGRDEPRATLSEYWLSPEGIEREVLQHEICKFLGPDATCRPGPDPRTGRPGFLIRAYRQLTSSMEQTLREETERWLRERDRRRRHGEPRGSYEQLAEERTRRYPTDMDVDMEDDYRPQAPVRHRDLRDPRDPRELRDPRDPREQLRDPREMEPRPVASGRIPVTSGYLPEPGYPAHQYTISSQQPGYPPGQPQYHGIDREPRTTYAEGSTPPTAISRASQSGAYLPPGYPSRSAPPVSQSIPTSYDPRARDVISGGGYSTGYPEQRSSRR